MAIDILTCHYTSKSSIPRLIEPKTACFGRKSPPYNHGLIHMFWLGLIVIKQTCFIKIYNFEVSQGLVVPRRHIQ